MNSTPPKVGDRVFVPATPQEHPLQGGFGGFNAGYTTIKTVKPVCVNARHQHCVWVEVTNYPKPIMYLWEGFLEPLQKSMKDSSIKDQEAVYFEDYFVPQGS
jgi:hypothetical protein